MSQVLNGSLVNNNRNEAKQQKRAVNVLFWIVQVILACLFLFAGSLKLILPLSALTAMFPLPGLFMRFIGIAEVSGALGLVLPGLFRVRRDLTPLAACGLVLVMIGATTLSLVMQGVGAASMPFVVGLLALGIAYGRSSWFVRG